MIPGYRDSLQIIEERRELRGMEFYNRRRSQEIQAAVLRTRGLSFGVMRKQKAVELMSFTAVLNREVVPKSLMQRLRQSEFSFGTILGIPQRFSPVTAEKEHTTFRVHCRPKVSTEAWLEGVRRFEGS